MATTFLWDADATFDTSLLLNPVGVSVGTDHLGTGHTHSLRVGNSGADNVDFPCANNASGRVSFYAYFVTFPGSDNSTWIHCTGANDGGTENFKWRINGSGVMKLIGSDNLQVGSDASIAVTVATRTRISYAWNGASVKLWINNSLAFSTTSAPSYSGMQFLNITTNGDGSQDFRISDVMIDSSSSLTDIASDVWVRAKRPVANGTTNGFTPQIGAGGSGYGGGHSPQVNERPLSQTNGWSMVGAGSAVTEEYTVEAANIGDVDVSGDTLIDWGAWVFAKALASETGSIIVGGSTSGIALTSTPTAFMAFKGSTSYPAGSTDVGIVTTTALTTVSLYECGVLIASIPGAPATVTRTLTSFEFRNDDGSEATATAAASEATNITFAPGTNLRLRMQTDTNSADPPSEAFKIQYRKVGDPTWSDL